MRYDTTSQATLEDVLEELFDRGKSYGEDIGYAKDEILYEKRISALDDAKKSLASLVESQAKRIEELEADKAKLLADWRRMREWLQKELAKEMRSFKPVPALSTPLSRLLYSLSYTDSPSQQ